MGVIQRVVKATTRKGKKVLLKREPQALEGVKRTLFFQGRKTSEKIRNLLKDFYNIRKPEARMLQRKNDVTIFENVTPVETFCKKNEAPLFVMGSHSKKRPDNLVVGRMYDDSLLDMIELGVEDYRGLKDFNTAKVTMGTKPCLIFNGQNWEQSDELKHLKSIFIDIFHREKVDAVRLQGIEHSISFTATDTGKILMRSYKILLKKSGNRIPRIELEEIGPRVNFIVRRSKLPSPDLLVQSLKEQKAPKPKKNVSKDGLGNKKARIHMTKQDINKLQTRKMKGLKKDHIRKSTRTTIKVT